ncbi:MAG: NifB/NifX family molybdenum-iron cluster-binding protein [Parasulfuritortus sp.]|nr:NifB/NifX family molybdenum-iron cluster-binding protein [Parasulfuritortus sp.]
MPEIGHIKIALTTNSLTRVDVAFTLAQQIVIYDIGYDSAEFLDAVRFTGGSAGKSKGKGGGQGGATDCWMNETDNTGPEGDRLTPRLDACQGCQVVFTKGLSDLAAVRMRDSRIFPVKMEEGRDIDEVITYMQNMMKSKPPLWLRKALGQVTGNPEYQVEKYA